MAVLPIYTYPHPVLRKKAKRVARPDDFIQRLIDDMLDTMHAAKGVGLAAPQVGVPLRLAVIELPGESPLVLINPEIIERKGEREVEEGCLSYPGYRGIVRRAVEVKVRARDRNGKLYRIKGTDLLAQALEHEIDHLDGILYLDRLVDGKVYKIEEDAE